MKANLGWLALILVGMISPLTRVQAQTVASDKGIDDVEVIKTSAVVDKVDLEKRKVTLILEDGKKKTFKVDQSVRKLDRVEVGDHLNLSYT